MRPWTFDNFVRPQHGPAILEHVYIIPGIPQSFVVTLGLARHIDGGSGTSGGGHVHVLRLVGAVTGRIDVRYCGAQTLYAAGRSWRLPYSPPTCRTVSATRP